jgi:MFS family permease
VTATATSTAFARRSEPAAPPAPIVPSIRPALAGLALATLLSSLGVSIANVGLPTLAQAFGASFQALQWVVLAYLLVLAALVLGAGRLGDLFGRRRLLLGGMALFTAASLAAALAPTLAWLVAARAAQGAGAAVMTALAMALVSETVPKTHAGRAMGLLGTMSAVGTALGPTLGGALISGWGWRALFLVKLPLGLLGLWLVHRYVPAEGAAPHAIPNAAPNAGPNAAPNAAPNARPPRTRAAGLRVFAQALRDVALRTGLATSALVSTVMMATLVVGPFYLSRTLGLPTALVGLAMSVGPLVSAVCGVPAGRAVDRFGAARMVLAGLAAAATGCLMLALLPVALGVSGYVAPLALVTAGYAVFQAANNTAVMAGAAADRRGVVSGLLNLSRQLGLIAGASAMGAVFALASGAADVATADAVAVAAGMRVSFGVAAGLIAVALGLAWRARTAART